MSAIDVDLGAIRRVSAGHGDVEQRVQDAETLGTLDTTDRRVLRALVQGLWDEDPDVRSACETALRTQFRATDAADSATARTTVADRTLREAVEAGRTAFTEAMNDDFNTREAFTALLNVASAVNSHLDATDERDYRGLRRAIETLEAFAGDVFGLDRVAGQLAGTLSGGWQKKLDLALGFLKRPDYLLLDEPFSELDDASKRRLLTFLTEFCTDDRTVLVVTHHVRRFEDIVDRLTVFDGGQVRYDGAVGPYELAHDRYLDVLGLE